MVSAVVTTAHVRAAWIGEAATSIRTLEDQEHAFTRKPTKIATANALCKLIVLVGVAARQEMISVAFVAATERLVLHQLRQSVLHQ